jgi:hypothetical protein
LPDDVKLYEKSFKDGWEYASYRGKGGRRTVTTDYKFDTVETPKGAREVVHTHQDGIALPSRTDMEALLQYRRGTVEAVLGRAFPHADAVLRKSGLPESGLVMKTTYRR